MPLCGIMEVYMNDCELITFITAIACGIINCCSEDDISLLSVGFTQLGDTLSTYLTQKELREKKNSNASGNNKSIIGDVEI
jgi:hypothetical protein